ncbi:MAG: hypothetical protein HXX17_15505 [Geobacteraceae bacterium]|nr:hypothetical protein [Geobacteraceae bacterium]
MKLKFLVLMLVLILAGCGSGGDSGGVSGTSTAPAVITEASNKAAYDKAILPLNEIYTRYKDARTVAGATPRIALAAPLSNMQSIKREADALVVAKCLDFAKSMLTGGMLNVNAAYVDFMQQGSSVSFLMNLGNTSFTKFEEEITKQKLCDFSIM